MRVLVVGAGIMGLTVGVRLAEAGYDVHLLARERPLETTSAAAAALWYPYRALPYDRVLRWSMSSYAEFVALAGNAPESGVQLRSGTELLTEPTPDPWWASAVPDLTRSVDTSPPYRDGWTFTAPVIDMSIYLCWLSTRLIAAGGTVTRMGLSGLPDRAPLVVNCSGLGARGLTGDLGVAPIRGQVVRVEQVGLERWTLDGRAPTYVVPRAHDIVLGGSADSDDWDTVPRMETAARILARAVALVPALAGVKVLGHKAGLRPGRPQVRLEATSSSTGSPVIHCYGHGGAGVTLSWGCADEVLDLVSRSTTD